MKIDSKKADRQTFHLQGINIIFEILEISLPEKYFHSTKFFNKFKHSLLGDLFIYTGAALNSKIHSDVNGSKLRKLMKTNITVIYRISVLSLQYLCQILQIKWF